MYILGIETSCDETAAAVVRNGTDILSSVVSSQVAVHHRFGGVVPELASRKHVEAIVPVVTEAVRESGLKTNQIDALAVTRGPGLVGALLLTIFSRHVTLASFFSKSAGTSGAIAGSPNRVRCFVFVWKVATT